MTKRRRSPRSSIVGSVVIVNALLLLLLVVTAALITKTTTSSLSTKISRTVRYRKEHRHLRLFETIAVPASPNVVSVTTQTTATHTKEIIDKILEHVDNDLLSKSSPSSTAEIMLGSNEHCKASSSSSIIERIRNEHNEDFITAQRSCLIVEGQHEEEEENMMIEEEYQQKSASSFPSSTPNNLAFERILYPSRRRWPSSLLRTSTENDVAVAEENENDSGLLAIRSTGPVLDADSVEDIRKAAEQIWDAGDDGATSRFTYQYSGNSEAHLFDFTDRKINIEAAVGARAVNAINKALRTKIYPMIRKAFFRDESRCLVETNNDDRGTRLFVYDALVIRYNATAACLDAVDETCVTSSLATTSASSAAAGQPLHRDLGLVSVNIMLNSKTEFEGGGTFFENQLLMEGSAEPLKPIDVGYCLAHSASERHAGAGTTNGVRDILVIFVSAADTKTKKKSGTVTAPAELRSALLKSCRSFCEKQVEEEIMQHNQTPKEQQWIQQQRSNLLCRILHQRLAVEHSFAHGKDALLPYPQQPLYDGEAVQYLGTALMEYGDYLEANGACDDSLRTLQVALDCFRIAAKVLTPCDARVYNNLGIVLGKVIKLQCQQQEVDDVNHMKKEQENAYKCGLEIIYRSRNAGCTTIINSASFECLSLNYGLFLANEDRFQEAAETLEPIIVVNPKSSNTGNDAYQLWEFCKIQSVADVGFNS